ncbi:MAG: tRNA lysidine(34) synthetase TilS [Candidatus Saccharibacteria bacterium]|nr:tRNA lysidine(34) synthetase TilS [Candidatus Saccharibacteria bacterium]
MKLSSLKTGTYIVAVSGGVDSVVLLDLLSKQSGLQLIIAHFDHGIRSNSATDSQFVKQLALKYDLNFELGSASLGKDASEEQARDARYSFLSSVKDKYNARQIITAHHSDDIVETIIINLTRGTGWRGLISLRSTEHVLRPLLNFTKADILAYAKSNKLSWVEDSTNQEIKYLRNEIRHKIVTKMSAEQRAEFLQLYQSQLDLTDEIDSNTIKLTSDKRHDFIMWPESVSLEVLRSQLKITRPQAKRALMAIKTAKPGTEIELSGDKSLKFTHKNILTVVK